MRPAAAQTDEHHRMQWKLGWPAGNRRSLGRLHSIITRCAAGCPISSPPCPHPRLPQSLSRGAWLAAAVVALGCDRPTRLPRSAAGTIGARTGWRHHQRSLADQPRGRCLRCHRRDGVAAAMGARLRLADASVPGVLAASHTTARLVPRRHRGRPCCRSSAAASATTGGAAAGRQRWLHAPGCPRRRRRATLMVPVQVALPGRSEASHHARPEHAPKCPHFFGCDDHANDAQGSACTSLHGTEPTGYPSGFDGGLASGS